MTKFFDKRKKSTDDDGLFSVRTPVHSSVSSRQEAFTSSENIGAALSAIDSILQAFQNPEPSNDPFGGSSGSIPVVDLEDVEDRQKWLETYSSVDGDDLSEEFSDDEAGQSEDLSEAEEAEGAEASDPDDLGLDDWQDIPEDLETQSFPETETADSNDATDAAETDDEQSEGVPSDEDNPEKGLVGDSVSQGEPVEHEDSERVAVAGDAEPDMSGEPVGPTNGTDGRPDMDDEHDFGSSEAFDENDDLDDEDDEPAFISDDVRRMMSEDIPDLPRRDHADGNTDGPGRPIPAVDRTLVDGSPVAGFNPDMDDSETDEDASSSDDHRAAGDTGSPFMDHDPLKPAQSRSPIDMLDDDADDDELATPASDASDWSGDDGLSAEEEDIVKEYLDSDLDPETYAGGEDGDAALADGSDDDQQGSLEDPEMIAEIKDHAPGEWSDVNLDDDQDDDPAEDQTDDLVDVDTTNEDPDDFDEADTNASDVQEDQPGRLTIMLGNADKVSDEREDDSAEDPVISSSDKAIKEGDAGEQGNETPDEQTAKKKKSGKGRRLASTSLLVLAAVIPAAVFLFWPMGDRPLPRDTLPDIASSGPMAGSSSSENDQVPPGQGSIDQPIVTAMPADRAPSDGVAPLPDTSSTAQSEEGQEPQENADRVITIEDDPDPSPNETEMASEGDPGSQPSTDLPSGSESQGARVEPEFGEDMRMFDNAENQQDIVDEALNRLADRRTEDDSAADEEDAQSVTGEPVVAEIDPEFLARVESMQDAMLEMQGTIEALNTEIQDLQQENSDLEESYSSLQDRVSQNDATRALVNQQLPQIFALEESLGAMDLRFVSVDDRLRSLEAVNIPQEARVAAETAAEDSMNRLESRLDQLNANIGIIARMAGQNSSPQPYTTSGGQPPQPSQPGSVFAPATQGVPAEQQTSSSSDRFVVSNKAEPTLRDVSTGDVVQGYGRVLRITPAQGGGKIVIMENGSIFVD